MARHDYFNVASPNAVTIGLHGRAGTPGALKGDDNSAPLMSRRQNLHLANHSKEGEVVFDSADIDIRSRLGDKDATRVRRLKRRTTTNTDTCRRGWSNITS